MGLKGATLLLFSVMCSILFVTVDMQKTNSTNSTNSTSSTSSTTMAPGGGSGGGTTTTTTKGYTTTINTNSLSQSGAAAPTSGALATCFLSSAGNILLLFTMLFIYSTALLMK